MLTQDARRWKPVRLTEVEPKLRLKAAFELMRDTLDEQERNELWTAAVEPSNRTYWIAA